MKEYRRTRNISPLDENRDSSMEEKCRNIFSVQLSNRLKSAGLEPVQSHTDKLCIGAKNSKGKVGCG